MREILFRGKTIFDKDNKWVYGVPCNFRSIRNELQWSIIQSDGTGCFLPDTIAVDENSIGQFTGLKDNNGKMIFEGDIIKTVLNGKGGGKKDYIVQIGVVQYNKDYFCIESSKGENKEWCSLYFSIGNEFSDCTVIGNIYDNPELIENKRATS